MSATAPPGRVGVPRDRENDCTRDAAARRREFLEERAGASLEHVSSYSFDPGVLPGNVEHARASSTCRRPRPRGRSSPHTTAG